MRIGFIWQMEAQRGMTGTSPLRTTQAVLEQKGFKYRTTLIGARLGDEIMWKDMELFECSELWKEREKIEFGEMEEVAITILEKRP